MVVPSRMDILQHQSLVRLSCFAGVLALMAVWEFLAPRRRLTASEPARWLSNLGLVAVDTLFVRLLLPFGAVGIALASEERGWGLFNNIALPGWLVVILSVVA